jgi:ketosteroid isomerase-like protein
VLELWAQDGNVSTMHPIGGREVGWDQVRNGWEQASAIIGPASAALEDVTVPDLQIIPIDENAAYTLGTEQVRANQGGQQAGADARATNIYRRVNGEWKMVHHHGDMLPQELIQGLLGQGGA